jgi:hypothetical protein
MSSATGESRVKTTSGLLRLLVLVSILGLTIVVWAFAIVGAVHLASLYL